MGPAIADNNPINAPKSGPINLFATAKRKLSGTNWNKPPSTIADTME